MKPEHKRIKAAAVTPDLELERKNRKTAVAAEKQARETAITTVTNNANSRVSKAGDTMTSLLAIARTLAGTPTAFLDMNATDGPTISARIGPAGEFYFRDVTNARTLLTLFASGEVGVQTLSANAATVKGAIAVQRALGGTPTAFMDMVATDGPTISMRIGPAGELYFRDVTNARTLLTLFASGEVGVHTEPTLDGSATTKRYVDAKTAMPAWIAPTLLNGWVPHASYVAPGYRKTPWGDVHLRGSLSSGTAANGTVIFNLPAGYRPAGTRHFVALQSGSTACRITIDAAGDVVIGGVTSNSLLSLESIRFDV